MMAWLKGFGIQRSLVLSGLLLSSASVNAQEASDYSAIEKNMDAFSSVLRENLGLDGRRSGNFNPFSNMSNAYYLAGQGVVMELNTQLSRSRATIGMRSLGTTLQQLADNFAQSSGRRTAVSREYLQELRDSMALSRQAEDAPEIYRDIVRQITEVDFPTEVDRALRSARESLRGLSGSEGVSEEMLAEFNMQMDELGEELRSNVDHLQSMRTEISTALREAHENREELAKEWQESLDQLLQNVEPIRESAIDKAQELSELREQELVKQQAVWDAQLLQFQSQVYSAVCEYGVLLKELPSDEHLSLILKGLGDKDTGSSEDLIIVLAKGDLERCQSSEINAEQLMELAQHYSF